MNTADPKFIRCRFWISRKNIAISRTNPLDVNSPPSFNVGAVGVNDLADAALAEDSLSEGVGKPQLDHNATPRERRQQKARHSGPHGQLPRAT
jgi:hypothetical protein